MLQHLTLKYDVNGVAKTTNFTDVDVDVSFDNSIISLIFPRTTQNYNILYDDMLGVLSDIEIDFTVMGASRTYDSLYMESVSYGKQIDKSSNEIFRMRIQFKYQGS